MAAVLWPLVTPEARGIASTRGSHCASAHRRLLRPRVGPSRRQTSERTRRAPLGQLLGGAALGLAYASCSALWSASSSARRAASSSSHHHSPPDGCAPQQCALGKNVELSGERSRRSPRASRAPSL